eukprot:324463-Chlamydomonas_euryale.AAC.10
MRACKLLRMDSQMFGADAVSVGAHGAAGMLKAPRRGAILGAEHAGRRGARRDSTLERVYCLMGS